MPVLIKTARTFPDQLLTHFRQQGDPPADAVIANVAHEQGRDGISTLMRWLADPNDTDLTRQPRIVQQFFAEYAHLPAWADSLRMARGMALFSQYNRQISLILGCYSLPYCYLGANGAQVLWLTERIKNDTARRLQETGEWVFGVNNPAEWKTGKAITRTLKVRLIHAGARWFTLQSGRWNESWGYPINQEDMAATSLAFSYIVLLGLRRLGVGTSEEQEEDYLHHINVVGYLNGVAERLIPQNLREAYRLERSIFRRQFAPSEAGAGLTRALLNAIAALVGHESGMPETSRNLAAAQMRFFLGDPYADALAIPAVPVEKQTTRLLNRLPIFSMTPGFQAGVPV